LTRFVISMGNEGVGYPNVESDILISKRVKLSRKMTVKKKYTLSRLGFELSFILCYLNHHLLSIFKCYLRN
jgi:hypothetical protein